MTRPLADYVTIIATNVKSLQIESSDNAINEALLNLTDANRGLAHRKIAEQFGTRAAIMDTQNDHCITVVNDRLLITLITTTTSIVTD